MMACFYQLRVSLRGGSDARQNVSPADIFCRRVVANLHQHAYKRLDMEGFDYDCPLSTFIPIEYAARCATKWPHMIYNIVLQTSLL